jgi:broad specificity phosphatase PhoE
MLSYLRLLLIRHAQSAGNEVGRMEGQGSTGLSPLGQWQAHTLGNFLKAQEFAPSHCYSSPLLRATQTAAALVAAWSDQGIVVQPVDALQELHQGIFQGLTWAEAVAHYPELCQQLMTHPQYLPVPEAETLVEAQHRVQRWWQQLLVNHQPGDRIWVISHGGLMQYLIAQILGCDRIWQMAIEPTALFEFWLAETDGDATHPHRLNPEWWKIIRFNTRPHLSTAAPPPGLIL